MHINTFKVTYKRRIHIERVSTFNWSHCNCYCHCCCSICYWRSHCSCRKYVFRALNHIRAPIGLRYPVSYLRLNKWLFLASALTVKSVSVLILLSSPSNKLRFFRQIFLNPLTINKGPFFLNLDLLIYVKNYLFNCYSML